jgi:hypothetical protein
MAKLTKDALHKSRLIELSDLCIHNERLSKSEENGKLSSLQKLSSLRGRAEVRDFFILL